MTQGRNNHSCPGPTVPLDYDIEAAAMRVLPDSLRNLIRYELPGMFSAMDLLRQMNSAQLSEAEALSRIRKMRQNMAVQAYGPDYPIETIK